MEPLRPLADSPESTPEPALGSAAGSAIGPVAISKTDNDTIAASAPSGRWNVAISFAVFIAVYGALLASGQLGSRTATVVNDFAWALASLAAGLVCLVASRNLAGREALTWRLIALGCGMWFLGQCVWNYYDLIVARVPLFPHWMQLLFLAYPTMLIVGMLLLPKPDALGMNVRRAGNLGLAVCTLVVIIAIAITEPAAQSDRTLLSVLFTLAHGLIYAVVCVVALYLLWSFSWQDAYWPLALIAFGSAIHTAAYVADVHSRMAASYEADAWLSNVAWTISFASIACAAYEFSWSRKHHLPHSEAVLLVRERWIEASMPALLVGAMVAMTVSNTTWISARVIYLICGAGSVFAVTLGIREAWVQREEQRLLAALKQSRDELLTANRELSDSEQRYRALNMQLERRVAERTDELQSAYRELESFSYAVAHDIKAPLRAVNAFGSLLIDEHGSKLDADAMGYVERMRRGALHMSQLVDDLLAYSRLERLELQAQPTDIAALIEACVTEQRDEAARLGAEIITELPQVLVHADPAALQQTFRNLLQNALKFSARATPPRVLIAATMHTDRLLIQVKDNGIGFDMQYHDKLFELFQRLHRLDEYPGTGIGLAIARKAVERMGGKIWAQSEFNKGATFYIELPIAKQIHQ